MDQQACNAHHIARHLRAIATILQSAEKPLTDEAMQAIGFDMKQWINLEGVAGALEASAPFVPLTDAERGEVLEWIVYEQAGYSTRERVDDVVGDWTDADWRMEFDQMQEYMSEED